MHIAEKEEGEEDPLITAWGQKDREGVEEERGRLFTANKGTVDGENERRAGAKREKGNKKKRKKVDDNVRVRSNVSG